MRAIIVYESIWGNTKSIAHAIEAALRPEVAVDIFSAEVAPSMLANYDLVIVGGPTHAFSMSRPATRDSAKNDHGANLIPEWGIREWIESVPHATAPVPVVTFDTRSGPKRLPGSAAKAARHELRSRGFSTAAKPQSFFVKGMDGPLLEGELSRATEWAQGILRSMNLAPAATGTSRAGTPHQLP